MKFLSAGLIGVLFSSAALASNASNRIEGGSAVTLQNNSAVLKSVLLIGMENSLCTGTLIAKNILLTAKHCTGTLAKGQVITLNEQKVKLMDVLSPVANTVSVNGKVTQLTDISLLLFSTVDCKNSVLSKIEPIALAKPNDRIQRSADLLLAGYGMSAPGADISAGVLRAGTNRIATAAQIAEIQKNINEDLGLADALITASVRTESASGTATPGAIFELEEILKEAEVAIERDATANVLQGDSGGSLIAFDLLGKPYVVGVTSMTAGIYTKMDYSVQVPGKAGSVLSGSATTQEIQKAGGLLPILAQAFLAQADLPLIFPVEVPVLSKDRLTVQRLLIPHNMQDFTLTLKYQRTSLSLFDSVTSAANSDFIEKGVANLTAQRTALGAEICQ